MNAKSKWLTEDGNIVAPNTMDSCVFGSDGKSLEEKLPFKFGIDENGNYGYIKNGEIDVTPFGTKTESIIGSNDVNYVFMSFKENTGDIVSTSSSTDPIPFTDIESSGLTVEDNKVKLEEGHKYFIIASAQNPTAHYINICNKDGIYVMNGSDGNYQATTQSCIYIAKKDDVIYLGVSNNNGGAGSVRRHSTFTVIELSGSSSANVMHNYSTEEKVVGTWIDGKPLYELTFTGNELSIPNVDHLHIIQSMAHSPTYDNYDPIPMPSYGVRWMFSKTNENLTLLDTTGFHDTYETTIQYTKTTDTATV